jgi:transcriptional regulator with PAS, ATPase and Fis domain
VKAGRFREDLYWRLRVVEILVPPLREHLEDIPELVNHFLAGLSADCHRQIRLTPAAMQKLQEYQWPGNVRQLRTVLESAVVMMNESGVLDVEDFRLGGGISAPGAHVSLNLQELELWAAQEALRRTNGNKAQAARMLAVARETFSNILKRGQVGASDGATDGKPAQ